MLSSTQKQDAEITRKTQGSRRFVVKRTATGLGLFAVKTVPAGDMLFEYTGPLVSPADVKRRRGKYFFRINTRWSIEGGPRTNTARYINRSCGPNAEAFITGMRV